MAVQIIRDNYSIINDNSKLKQTFVIGSRSIRGLQPKKEEIAQWPAYKDVDNCGLQEIKCRVEECEEGDNKFVSFDTKLCPTWSRNRSQKKLKDPAKPTDHRENVLSNCRKEENLEYEDGRR